ncbi:MAG: serine hydrolase domain-containing protein [Dehalococcoidia bacterium]
MPDLRATARVQALLDQLIAEDGEAGLQVASYLNGELLIDAWAGVADAASGRPVAGDTLFTSFSTTKGVVATAIHMLAERGTLDYDAPVATYWPEYAQNGKGATTLRHVLTHREGVPQVPDGVTPEMLADWDEICRRVAALTPIWEPGTHTGYHAYVYGWILGEVARRADGRPIERFITDEITGPLGIDDWYLGMPDEVEPRMATLITAPLPPGMPALSRDALLFRAIPLDIFPAAHVYNRRDVRRAVIPAGGGIMSARGIARHYAALAEGGSLNGVRLLSPERLKLATALQDESQDEVLGRPIPRALGYWLGDANSPMSARRSAFGHPGAGGSIAFADPKYHLAVGFTKNLLRNVIDPADDPGLRVCNEVRAALGIPNA